MLPKGYKKPSEYKTGGATKKSSSPKPTNPSLWARAKSLAKQKFDVYPSAYANGWAAKWYKENGGGWSGGSNKKAEGGAVNYQQGGSPDGLTHIQNGGTHEESTLGGVPMGRDGDGNQVLVEEGETVRRGEETDFVFSDRLRLTKQDAEEFAIDKKFVGQTFADISKKLETRSRRKNDPIDRQTIDIQLNRLEEAQEAFKQRKLAEAQEMYGGSREPSPEQSMEPPMGSPMGAPQGPSPEEMAIMQAMQQGAAGMGPQGMGQPSPEMMPPQGPPQMMNYGGLIYANGGPTTQTQAQRALDNYFRSLGFTHGINDPRAPKRDLYYDESLGYFYRDEAGNIINTDLGQQPSQQPSSEDQMITDGQATETLYGPNNVAPYDSNYVAPGNTFTSNLLDVLGAINTDGTITIDNKDLPITPYQLEDTRYVDKPEFTEEGIKRYAYKRYLAQKACAEGDKKACYDEYTMLESIDPNAAEDYFQIKFSTADGNRINYPSFSKVGNLKKRQSENTAASEPTSTEAAADTPVQTPEMQPTNRFPYLDLLNDPNFRLMMENEERRSQRPATQTSATQPTEATAQALEDQMITDAQALEALYNSNYVTPGGYNTENFSPMMPDPNSYTTPYIQTIFPFLNPDSSTTTSPNSSNQTAATASTTSAPVAAPAQQAAGAQGTAGAQSSTGPTGPTGAQGVQGTTGTQGTTGAQGAQGTAGAQGAAPAQAQQTTVTPAQVSASTPGLNMASNAPEAITFGATGPYSTEDGDLVIPSEQGNLVIPSGYSMPKFGSQPEMPTYETPRGLTGVQSLPVATNLLSSILLPKGFKFEDYRIPQDDSIIQKKDITPDLQDIDKMTQMGRNAISARATSTGELLVGLGRLTAMGMAEMGKIRNQQYSDYLEQLEAQKLRNLQIAQMNSQTRAAVDAANADL